MKRNKLLSLLLAFFLLISSILPIASKVVYASDLNTSLEDNVLEKKADIANETEEQANDTVNDAAERSDDTINEIGEHPINNMGDVLNENIEKEESGSEEQSSNNQDELLHGDENIECSQTKNNAGTSKIETHLIPQNYIEAKDVSTLPHTASFEGESEAYYRLSFTIDRYPDRDEDNAVASYYNYWYKKPENEVFDVDAWSLKDFSVKYYLYIDGHDEPLISYMTYTSADYTFDGEISFENIPIPFEEVEVEYYSPEGKDYFESYLLEYNIFLKTLDNKITLKIPELRPKEGYTGNAKVLPITNLKVKELGTKLYLNGASGDDGNDGLSAESPLKTFDKAKEIATNNQRIMEIIVTGTTPLEGDISLQGTKATVVRSDDFDGYLFCVDSSKQATLSNIAIDGNVDNRNIEKALINVTGGSTLIIQSGTILRNNNTNTENYHTKGGAINASNSTIDMSGGLIENNTAVYGGGIYLENSTLNFFGGTIQNNLAKRHGPDDRNQIYAAGGGILADKGSSVYIYEQAKVLNNRSDEVGGGISIGSNQSTTVANTLLMQGGIIDGNTAGSSGGGIFIQALLYKNLINKGVITAGQITNNEMDGSGVLDKAFGGGGIYVNGMPESIILGKRTYYTSNGELEIHNALITDNSSANVGAGYAACPISKTNIYITDGVAICGNSTNKDRGQDIYILSQPFFGFHGGIPEYQLSVRSLGGVPNEWRTEDGVLLPLEKYEGKLPSYTDLALHTNNEANELINKLAKVIISGNYSATRGGGIGSNGTVTFGTPGTTEVRVQKKWESNDGTIPASISVDLVLNLDGKEYVLETREISAESGWQTTFSNLPTKINGQDAFYSVKEEEVKGYKTTITGDASLGFTITNTYQPDTIEVNGVKTWNDNNNQDGTRPESIIIRLYADGTEVDSKTVTEADGWKWSFTGLDKYKDGEAINYTITEDAVAGYTSKVQGYNVTNSYTPGKTQVAVTKAWNDGNNQDGKRPNEVIIKLLADGVETGKELILNDANSWTGTFSDLAEYEAGQKIVYTIEEVAVEGYTSTITGDVATGYTVTNSSIPNLIQKIPKTGVTATLSFVPLLGSASFLLLIRKRLTKKR